MDEGGVGVCGEGVVGLILYEIFDCSSTLASFYSQIDHLAWNSACDDLGKNSSLKQSLSWRAIAFDKEGIYWKGWID